MKRLIHIFRVLLVACIILQGQSLSAQVAGSVFHDFNTNGLKDVGEANIGGVTVTAFNSAGASVSVTTMADGTYSFPNSGITASGTPLRIEFSGLPAYLETGYGGATSVRFVTAGAGATGINYWGINPENYCQSNPKMVTTCYTANPAEVNDIVVSWSYNNTGTAALDKSVLTSEASAGSVWGLAYARSSQTIYTSALLKTHIPLGPGGLDAIYTVDPTSGVPNATPWLELTDDLGIAVSNVMANPQYLTNATRGVGVPPQNDASAYTDSGKMGLGDIELSMDERTLYVVNVYDKTLYAIDIATKTLAGSFPIPNPGCTSGQARPWAIGQHNGNIYVGVICDGSASGNPADVTDNSGVNNLTATVYRLDGASFTSVLDFPLNYLREPNNRYAGGACETTNYWKPWMDVVPFICPANVISYPTPLLTDIEFDDRGNMILGFTDRTGFQIDNGNYGPSGTTLYDLNAGGDILKACYNGSDWDIEGTGGCQNSLGEALNTITVNGYSTTCCGFRSKPGEFYSGDYFHENGGIDRTGLSFDPAHAEIVVGGLVVVPGTGEVMATVYDPVTGAPNYATGGVIRLDNTSGQRTSNGFEIYDNVASTQGKGVGLGDLIALCNTAPLEIGNRIWRDVNDNGVQDPNEPGIDGIAVTLWKDDGAGNFTQISSATTDGSGSYYFSSAAGVSTGSNIFGVSDLLPNMNYELRFPTTATVGPDMLSLTTPNNGGVDANASSRDSDATVAGVVPFTTGDAGRNNHNYDVGYRMPPCPDIPCGATTAVKN